MITSHERTRAKASGRVKGGMGNLAIHSALRSSTSVRSIPTVTRIINDSSSLSITCFTEYKQGLHIALRSSSQLASTSVTINCAP